MVIPIANGGAKIREVRLAPQSSPTIPHPTSATAIEINATSRFPPIAKPHLPFKEA